MKGSASFTELGPDRVVDQLERHAVVGGERRRRFAGSVALDNDLHAYSRADDRWPTEAALRIDDDALRLRVGGASHERENADRQAIAVPVDPLEARLQRTAHGDLTVLGSVDELAPLIDEEIDTVRLELDVDEGTLDVKLAPDVQNGLTHPLQGDTVSPAHGSEHERLDKMGEGQKARSRWGQDEQALTRGPLSMNPSLQRADWNAHERGRLRHGVRGRGTRIGETFGDGHVLEHITWPLAAYANGAGVASFGFAPDASSVGLVASDLALDAIGIVINAISIAPDTISAVLNAIGIVLNAIGIVLNAIGIVLNAISIVRNAIGIVLNAIGIAPIATSTVLNTVSIPAIGVARTAIARGRAVNTRSIARIAFDLALNVFSPRIVVFDRLLKAVTLPLNAIRVVLNAISIVLNAISIVRNIVSIVLNAIRVALIALARPAIAPGRAPNTLGIALIAFDLALDVRSVALVVVDCVPRATSITAIASERAEMPLGRPLNPLAVPAIGLDRLLNPSSSALSALPRLSEASGLLLNQFALPLARVAPTTDTFARVPAPRAAIFFHS